jgi:hypothetical protein
MCRGGGTDDDSGGRFRPHQNLNCTPTKV